MQTFLYSMWVQQLSIVYATMAVPVDILSNNMTKMTKYAQAKGQLLIKW